MADKKILEDYISSQVNKGHNYERIRKTLIEVGHGYDLVNDSIKSVHFKNIAVAYSAVGAIIVFIVAMSFVPLDIGSNKDGLPTAFAVFDENNGPDQSESASFDNNTEEIQTDSVQEHIDTGLKDANLE